MKILQIVVTTVIGRTTILKSTVMVFLSLNRQAALTKLISDNKKAKPCKSTMAIWLCISFMSIVNSPALFKTWPYFIKIDKFMTIRGMEQIQACTIRKQFEINLINFEFSCVESKFHRYLKKPIIQYSTNGMDRKLSLPSFCWSFLDQFRSVSYFLISLKKKQKFSFHFDLLMLWK